MLKSDSRARIIRRVKIMSRLFNWIRARRHSGVAASKQRTHRRSTGDKGEDHALTLLRKRGDTLVVRNWSCKSGELDVVTWHGRTLVFTEVRTRSGTAFGTPAESVDYRKQEKLRRAAHAFLATHFRDGKPPECRFDIVWIVLKDGAILDSGIIEGAFV